MSMIGIQIVLNGWNLKMSEDNIGTAVRERFMEKYPNVSEKFKDDLACFVGWVVDETLKIVGEKDD